MSEEWDNLFGDMQFEGDRDRIDKTIIDLSPDDTFRYITLGLYYETSVMKERTKEQLKVAKAKIAKDREDDSDLETLQTRVEYAVMLQEKLKDLTTASNELFLQIQKNEWL